MTIDISVSWNVNSHTLIMVYCIDWYGCSNFYLGFFQWLLSNLLRCIFHLTVWRMLCCKFTRIWPKESFLPLGIAICKTRSGLRWTLNIRCFQQANGWPLTFTAWLLYFITGTRNNYYRFSPPPCLFTRSCKSIKTSLVSPPPISFRPFFLVKTACLASTYKGSHQSRTFWKSFEFWSRLFQDWSWFFFLSLEATSI